MGNMVHEGNLPELLYDIQGQTLNIGDTVAYTTDDSSGLYVGKIIGYKERKQKYSNNMIKQLCISRAPFLDGKARRFVNFAYTDNQLMKIR